MSSQDTTKIKWSNFESALFLYPSICFIFYLVSNLITDQVRSVFHYSWTAALILSVWIIAAQILKSADDATRIRSTYSSELD